MLLEIVKMSHMLKQNVKMADQSLSKSKHRCHDTDEVQHRLSKLSNSKSPMGILHGDALLSVLLAKLQQHSGLYDFNICADISLLLLDLRTYLER